VILSPDLGGNIRGGGNPEKEKNAVIGN